MACKVAGKELARVPQRRTLVLARKGSTYAGWRPVWKEFRSLGFNPLMKGWKRQLLAVLGFSRAEAIHGPRTKLFLEHIPWSNEQVARMESDKLLWFGALQLL